MDIVLYIVVLFFILFHIVVIKKSTNLAIKMKSYIRTKNNYVCKHNKIEDLK